MRFKTYGCVRSLSSLITEWVKGRSIEEAQKYVIEIANELSLPPVKIHCSILAEDAIKAAVDSIKKKFS